MFTQLTTAKDFPAKAGDLIIIKDRGVVYRYCLGVMERGQGPMRLQNNPNLVSRGEHPQATTVGGQIITRL